MPYVIALILLKFKFIKKILL